VARSFAQLRSHSHQVAATLAFVGFAGCAPSVVVGTWKCPDVADASNGLPDGGTADAGVIPFPWSGSFEDGFCSYPSNEGEGFCYDFTGASRQIVTSPVHSGGFAAAFTVDVTSLLTDGAPRAGASQARCVRQGLFPAEAYYGAWYFIPSPRTNNGTWNLFHFQAGARGGRLDRTWDVSLSSDGSGNLRLTIFDFFRSMYFDTNTALSVPIGSWFHVEFFLRRAADATGEVTLYQDGVVVYDLPNVVTDNSSDFCQWYVGNYADNLSPLQSTVYVDDVEIKDTL
jgi:hypothetical protein